MTMLTLKSAAHKETLQHAVAVCLELTLGALEDCCEGMSGEDIMNLGKRVAFLEEFGPALSAQPVGMSVFLEGIEINTLREALELMAEDGMASRTVDDVTSIGNIQSIIVATQTAWGAVDTVRLSQELAKQVREAVDPNTVIDELLDALN